MDDGISDQEDGSDIFETVGGEEESNTGGFDWVSDDGGVSEVSVTGSIGASGFFDQGTEFFLGLFVVFVFLELGSLGINLGLKEIESLGGTSVLVDEALGFIEGDGE